jgi:hypothetical protein
MRKREKTKHAQALASLSAKVPKTFSKAERARRRKVMIALNAKRRNGSKDA